jgi:hypothetical protein
MDAIIVGIVTCVVVLVLIVFGWVLFRKWASSLSDTQIDNWNLDLCPKKGLQSSLWFLEGWGTATFHCAHCGEHLCSNRGCCFEESTVRPGTGSDGGTMPGAGGENI